VYSTFLLLVSWILPLFPAEPKLGPVYHHVVQFIPPEFPLLLIVPAFALDLLWQRASKWGAWKQSLVSGVVFVAVFAAVQWPFGDFLMSPASRNWVFGTEYFSYFVRTTSLYARHLFLPTETGAAFWTEAAIAIAVAIGTTRFGLAWGDWMRRIKR
jgi:hypothetical protein